MFGDRLPNNPKACSPKTSKLENVKDDGSFKLSGSPIEGPLTASETKPPNNDSCSADSSKTDNVLSNLKEKKIKKKSSWFNSFYPTYKSRSEDFKRIFKEVPDDERLLVDYSCAVQKEILVHGRLYSTQNFLCFYANIFGWETNIVVKWKDVTAITKEKTAIVIPNAIMISTQTEKYFFTSFVARDKVYLMLFRVWQNALMDRQMSSQEMWKWVHQSYGAELGLTSDDEDYVAPGTEEEKTQPKEAIMERLKSESFNGNERQLNATVQEKEKNESSNQSNGRDLPCSEARGSTDLSDTDFSDLDLPSKCDNQNARCVSPHDGRQLVNCILPIHVDQLFTLLFTSSKFYLDFHASRKTSNIVQTPWTQNSTNNSKQRVVNLTVALSQPIGPKFSQVTETQIMLPCSTAGVLYSINAESVSGGVPYGDSFYIDTHFCIKKVSETQSSLAVYAQVKFKKSVWGLVKGMIEKNCWSGLEDFFSSLSKALQTECERYVPEEKKKTKQKRKIQTPPTVVSPISPPVPVPSPKEASPNPLFSEKFVFFISIVLILLVILNGMLYYKLRSLEEENSLENIFDVSMLKDPPTTYDQWVKLLQKQDQLHRKELKKWQEFLNSAITALKESKSMLFQLQQSIQTRNPLFEEDITESNTDKLPKAEL